MSDVFRRLLAAVLLSTTLTPFAANAEPDSTLVLAAPHWPPYLTGDEDKPGFAVEIISSAFATVGMDVEMKIAPWRRVIWLARNQQADGLAGVWYREARTEFLMFSDPYLESPIVAVYHKDRPLPGCDPEHLAGKRVGMRSGAWYGGTLMNNQHLEPIRVSHDQSMLSMLSQKRLDGAIGDALVLGDLIRNNPELKKSLKLCDTSLVDLPLHFAAARSAPDAARLVEQFNRGLENLRESGELEAIKEKYRGSGN